MRANAQAIGVQKHSLRQNPKARQLRTMLPEPKLLERCGKYGYFAANFAVCITIVLLIMIGVFSFTGKFHSLTQKVNERPYTGQVDQDIVDGKFPLIDTPSE
jgi:hypothetical protein